MGPSEGAYKKRKLKQIRKSVGYLQKKPFTKQEQLMLIKEMSKEFEIVKKANVVSAKSIWPYVLNRLEKRKFLNMNFCRLRSLWNKLKMSAKTHSKESGGDEIDTQTWKLLQMHSDYSKKQSKIKNEKDCPGTSKNDDQMPVNNHNTVTDNTAVGNAEKEPSSCDAASEPDNNDNGVESEEVDDEFDENSERSVSVKTDK